MAASNAERQKKYVETLPGRLKELVKGAKLTCKTRGDREFSITYKDVLDLWELQEGLCAYTGRPMTTLTKDKSLVSIERKDNAQGYIKDNIILVTWYANRARGPHSFEDFVEMCKAVASRYT